MMELREEDIQQEPGCELIDLEDEDLVTLIDRSGTSLAEKFRFDRVQNENNDDEKEGASSPSAMDPLYVYYRSMSKIPLLTREQEVQLAKTIETSKLNILRLLSLTAITSSKVLEMADKLQPVETSHPLYRFGIGDAEDGDVAVVERKAQVRIERIQKLVERLKRQEARYRSAKLRTSRRSNNNKLPSRETMFESLRTIDFNEDQISELISEVDEVLATMERAQRAVRNSRSDARVDQKARLELRRLETQHLTTVEELRKIRAAVTKDRNELLHAKDQFIRSNLRLVLNISKKYSCPGFDFLDLVQEGNIGLMKAVERFNYHLGNKFSTYATWWIRQSITRAMADQGRTIRVPVHMVEAMSRATKAANDFRKRFGHEASKSELSRELKIPVSKVAQILEAAHETISLEASMFNNDAAVLNDFVEDRNAISPMDPLFDANLRELAESALNSLSIREREILRMRYGLNEENREYTLQECGEKFRVTRERIRQIEEGALIKLRVPHRIDKLRDYADYLSN